MPKPANHDHAAWDPAGPIEGGLWISNWHVPHNIQRLLPHFVLQSLREFKLTGNFRSPRFSRDIEFPQAAEDAEASASVSVIVPIHDAPEVTRRCLASLEKYAPKSEVILVDDASKLSASVELIADFSDRNRWRMIRHETPLGHSAGCRDGVGLATRPYLCLLNSDTVVTPSCWRRVKEGFESDDKIAVAGPSTSHSKNPQTLALAADPGEEWNDNQICGFAEHLLNGCREPLLLDIPWVSGFAFFIRRTVWDELDGFDRKLPDYGNELELCRRVAEKGYRMVWIRNSYIHHLGHQSYRESIGEEEIRARVRAANVYIRNEKPSLEKLEKSR